MSTDVPHHAEETLKKSPDAKDTAEASPGQPSPVESLLAQQACLGRLVALGFHQELIDQGGNPGDYNGFFMPDASTQVYALPGPQHGGVTVWMDSSVHPTTSLFIESGDGHIRTSFKAVPWSDVPAKVEDCLKTVQ